MIRYYNTLLPFAVSLNFAPSISAARLKAGGTAMFALLALAGDVGCSLGPTTVGIVSGWFQDNLRMGILFAVFFPVLLLILLALLKNMGQKKSNL